MGTMFESSDLGSPTLTLLLLTKIHTSRSLRNEPDIVSSQRTVQTRQFVSCLAE